MKPKSKPKIPLRRKPWDHMCVGIADGVAQGHLWLRVEEFEGEIEDRKRASVVALAVIRALAERFEITPEAVDAAMYGSMGGWNRAHKYDEDATDDRVQDTERQYIEGDMAELLPEGDE